jgi:hypothetical protein
MMLPTLFTLADSSSPSERVMIWTLILTSAGGLATSLFSLIKGQMDRTQARKDKESEDHAAAELREHQAKAAAELREQDRLDAESKARIILLEGSRREQRLAAKIDENTEVSKQAFEAANGHNEKIAAVVQTVAEVAKVAKGIAETGPKEIHVTVDNAK